jgi:hypothetical protein
VPRYIWNANITLNEAHGDPSGSPTSDYLVSGNLIYTTDDQIAAIRVDAGERTAGLVIRDNVLRGENCKIVLEGRRQKEVVLDDNDRAVVVENKSAADIGQKKVEIPRSKSP